MRNLQSALNTAQSTAEEQILDDVFVQMLSIYLASTLVFHRESMR